MATLEELEDIFNYKDDKRKGTLSDFDNLFDEEDVEPSSIAPRDIDSNFSQSLQAGLSNTFIGRQLEGLTDRFVENMAKNEKEGAALNWLIEALLPAPLEDEFNKRKADVLERRKSYFNNLANYANSSNFVDRTARRVGEELFNPLNYLGGIGGKVGKALQLNKMPLLNAQAVPVGAIGEEIAGDWFDTSPESARFWGDISTMLTPAQYSNLVKNTYLGAKKIPGLIGSAGDTLKNSFTTVRDTVEGAIPTLASSLASVYRTAPEVVKDYAKARNAKRALDIAEETNLLNKTIGNTRDLTDPALMSVIEGGANLGHKEPVRILKELDAMSSNPVLKEMAVDDLMSKGLTREEALETLIKQENSIPFYSKETPNLTDVIAEDLNLSRNQTLPELIQNNLDESNLVEDLAGYAEQRNAFGGKIKDMLNSNESVIKEGISKDYQQFYDKVGDLPVDLSPEQFEKVKDVITEGRGLLPETLGNKELNKWEYISSVAGNENEEIASSVKNITFKDVQKAISDLRERAYFAKASGNLEGAYQFNKEADQFSNVLRKTYPKEFEELSSLNKSAKAKYYDIYTNDTGKLSSNAINKTDNENLLDLLKTKEDYATITKRLNPEDKIAFDNMIRKDAFSKLNVAANNHNAKMGDVLNVIKDIKSNSAIRASMSPDDLEKLNSFERRLALADKHFDIDTIPVSVTNKESADKFLQQFNNPRQIGKLIVQNSMFELMNKMDNTLVNLKGNKLEKFNNFIKDNQKLIDNIHNFGSKSSSNLVDELLNNFTKDLQKIPGTNNPENIYNVIDRSFRDKPIVSKLGHALIKTFYSKFGFSKRQSNEGIQEFMSIAKDLDKSAILSMLSEIVAGGSSKVKELENLANNGWTIKDMILSSAKNFKNKMNEQVSAHSENVQKGMKNIMSGISSTAKTIGKNGTYRTGRSLDTGLRYDPYYEDENGNIRNIDYDY